MWKALWVLLLWGAAAVCFWRAYLIQRAHSVDGIVMRTRPYQRLRLWATAGAFFLVWGLLTLAGAFDPDFMPMNGKR